MLVTDVCPSVVSKKIANVTKMSIEQWYSNSDSTSCRDANVE